jgi:hypothetical protein
MVMIMDFWTPRRADHGELDGIPQFVGQKSMIAES